MTQMLGLVLVIALVFGALFYSTGPAVLAAVPIELGLIGGAALGALLIGNSMAVSKQALLGFPRAIAGPRWKQGDYSALLSLLHELMRRARKGGVVAIEQDIEAPESSALFDEAARLRKDPAIEAMICNTFRVMALGAVDPDRTDAQMDRAISANMHQRMRPVSALHTIADALPALGIVAAVLGIIRTMGSIDQSPAILGTMIGTALLGTFLGVFLAYGVVGPIAARYGQVLEEEAGMLETTQAVLSAYVRGTSPRAAIEIGRAAIAPHLQPDMAELDHSLQQARFSESYRAA